MHVHRAKWVRNGIPKQRLTPIPCQWYVDVKPVVWSIYVSNFLPYQNGGLYCDESGAISKPFPDKPYCVDGTGALKAQNEAGDHVAICQTILPGNEAMLIPTSVTDVTELAVPGPSYWCSTAAQ
jgi:hypothetical protein